MNSIAQLVEIIAPKLYAQNTAGVLIFKEKWMNILYDALLVSEENKLDDTKYPDLGKWLIAYLIVRDILISPFVDSMGISFQDWVGSIKRIVTGPTEVERNSISEDLKALLIKGGPLEMFQAQICTLASSLGIYITGCPESGVHALRVLRYSDSSYLHKEIAAPEFIKHE